MIKGTGLEIETKEFISLKYHSNVLIVLSKEIECLFVGYIYEAKSCQYYVMVYPPVLSTWFCDLDSIA